MILILAVIVLTLIQAGLFIAMMRYHNNLLNLLPEQGDIYDRIIYTDLRDGRQYVAYAKLCQRDPGEIMGFYELGDNQSVLGTPIMF